MSWQNKRILITGAAGFIGQNLVRRLMGKTEITCVDNFSLGMKDNLKFFDGTVIETDVDENLPNFDRPFDIIYHFASPCSIIQFNKNPFECVRSTILSFGNIIKLAEKDGAKLIYPSTGNVYGTSYPNSEFTNPQPTNLYAISKLICEKLAEKAKVNTVGLRIFAGYGPGEAHKKDLSSAVTMFLNDIKQNKKPVIWGDGNQTRDFIFIDDIIDALIIAGEKNVAPIINLGTGKSTSFNEVVFIINTLLGKNIQPVYVPKPKFYVEKTEADTKLMKKELEINPVSLKEGIKKCLYM